MSGSQQLLLGGDDGFVFSAVISSNTANYNLRSAAIAAGWDQVKPLRASLTINAGIYLYANSTGVYALNASGSFPSGSSLSITNNGYIVGCGGAGGKALDSYYNWAADPACEMGYSYGHGGSYAGGNGGPAVITGLPTAITNNGVIGGGGGGGGSGAHGGIDESDGRGPKSWRPGGGGGGGQSFQTAPGGPGASFSNYSDYGCNHVSPGTGCSSNPGGAGGSGVAGAGGSGASFLSGGICLGYGGNGGSGGSWGAPGDLGGAGGGQARFDYCFSIYNQIAGSGYGAGGACLVGNANVTWAVQGNRYGSIS